MFEETVVIDGRGHLMGRLAAVIAKELLNGQHITVVRTEEINISGSRTCAPHCRTLDCMLLSCFSKSLLRVAIGSLAWDVQRVGWASVPLMPVPSPLPSPLSRTCRAPLQCSATS